MKNLKKIKENYFITVVGEKIGLVSIRRPALEKDSILLGVRSNFDDKLLEVASEVEKKQTERLDRIQGFSSEIVMQVQRLNDERMCEDLLECVDELKQIEKRVNETVDSMNNERQTLYQEINERLVESLSEECSFLNRGAEISMKHGDTARALELKQLIRSMLRNASDVVSEVVHQYEEAIFGLCEGMWNLIEEKNSLILEFTEYVKEQATELLEQKMYLDDMAVKNQSNAPKTHNELKKYLESNGFEIDRHNGSHQIYKNNQSGEVRVLPSRRGAHVLAPKTRKKIIEGVIGM